MKVFDIAQRALALALAAAIVPLAMAPASAAQSSRSGEEDTGFSPWRAARLTYITGEVSVLEPYSDGWEGAELNTPLFEGYEIYADSGDRAELALGGFAFLRFGDGADVTLEELDPGWSKIGVVSGTTTLSIQQEQRVGHYELSTPTAAITPERPGVFRVDVADNGDTWLTVTGGPAQVSTPNGSFQVIDGDIVSMSYDRPEDIELFGDAVRWNRDSWDRWNEERDDYFAGLYRRNQPDIVQALVGREDIFGLAELALYGTWLTVGSGMMGWQPEAARQQDWSPYQDGYWDYSTVTGWTWVSNEPWGWAPYHHGRWYFDDRNGWVWVPTHGDSMTTTVQANYRYKWHPALVYMWQPSEYDGYAWVPLAPGERYIPFSTTERAAPRAPVAQQRYVPRYLDQRRGILSIDTNAIMKRQKPMRASAVVLQKIESQRQSADRAKSPTTPVAPAPTVAVIPKPARGNASLAPARMKPSEMVRRRAVVVDTKTEAAAPKATDPTQSATSDPKTARTERKGKNVQLRLERKKASQAGLGQPGAAQGGTAPAPTQSTQPSSTTQDSAAQPAPGRRGGRKLKLANQPTGATAPAAGEPASPSGQQPRTTTGRKPVVTVQKPATTQPDTATQPNAGTATDPSTQTSPDTATQPQPGQRKGKGQGKKRRAPLEGQQPPANTTEPEKKEEPPPPQR
jgi:hypothetical protein